MNQPTTFLERVRTAIDALPDGADKDKLLALAEAQDSIERVNIHPKDRDRAMRRLLQIDTTQVSDNGSPAKARGKIA